MRVGAIEVHPDDIRKQLFAKSICFPDFGRHLMPVDEKRLYHVSVSTPFPDLTHPSNAFPPPPVIVVVHLANKVVDDHHNLFWEVVPVSGDGRC